MKLLIEDYAYPPDVVLPCGATRDDLFKGLASLQNIEKNIVVGYVGYFYNPEPTVRDCVFVLPKVIIDSQERVFGKYDPRDIIDVDNSNVLTDEERNFLYKFSVWIYRAIVVYRDTHIETECNPDKGIIYHKLIQSVAKIGKRGKSNTLLDVIISLIRFNRDNQNYLTFILRNIHSGYNKINWVRTIATTSATMQDEQPVYLRPVNKRRQINFDEELIIIFFSILHYIADTYGFNVQINYGFTLIKGAMFERYLNGYGRTRLRQIKYKYFSDTLLRLWEMCYAFFVKEYEIKVNNSQSEYLLAKNFNIVFEAMIDELVGEDHRNIPKGLQEQKDGKLVDHFYTYEGLLLNHADAEDRSKDDIYYIGDSKYYKIGNAVGEESIYKQYTYARNVIQWNLDLFLNPEAAEKEPNQYRRIKLRDDRTEGYDVIPNFFISAKLGTHEGEVHDYLSYEDQVTAHDHQPPISRQFKNRLYDRDTLLLSHYDVNFLYILMLYARNNTGQKTQWKGKVRKKFREEIQQRLAHEFSFYAMEAHPDVNVKQYFKEHFQDTLGKVFTPFESDDVFSLALDKGREFKDENEQLLSQLAQNFYVVECALGENPSTRLAQKRLEVGDVESPAAFRGKFLMCKVGDTESENLQYNGHEATEYNLRNYKGLDIMDVRYFCPIVFGKIDGYYTIAHITVKTQKDENGNLQPVLHLDLSDYTPLGTEWVHVRQQEKKHGTIKTFSQLMALYNK